MPSSSATPTSASLNLCWARLLFEELKRLRIQHVCLTPGSRSTPLAVAVALLPELTTHVHFDERGAAFYALGLARATGVPVALVCTSGSALANYFPAIVEASMDAVPLILLTADRPPELRHSGANQTIDQNRIFGAYVRHFVDLPCPDIAIPVSMLLTTVDLAVRRAVGPVAGPVQLNCMYREPFLPETLPQASHLQIRQLLQAVPGIVMPRAWIENGKPLAPMLPPETTISGPLLDELASQLRMAAKPLLVVGRLNSDADAAAVRLLCRHLLWPVLADTLSGLRAKEACPGLLRHGELLLNATASRDLLRPDLVVHLGGRITSKRLLELLRDSSPRVYIQVQGDSRPDNPHHLAMRTVEGPIAPFCTHLAQRLPAGAGDLRLAALLTADNRLASRLAQALDALHATSPPPASTIASTVTSPDAASTSTPAGASPGKTAAGTTLSELNVTRAVARLIPADDALFLSSSLPIREMDSFVGVLPPPPSRLAANRGASGIDGNLATAIGFGVGHKRVVTLVIGDVALLHDLNSLALARTAEVPVVIVVFNNDGGGIFHFLPVARQAPALFERTFATPHGRTFGDAARMFDLHYERPADLPAFETAYRAALTRFEPTLIEVTTTRENTHAQYTQTLAMASNWIETP